MNDRHKKFLGYMHMLYPDLSLVSVEEEELVKIYSKKVFLLLFVSSEEGDMLAPLCINSQNIWLKSAALFRFSNPL
jgi:hypothetical protein